MQWDVNSWKRDGGKNGREQRALIPRGTADQAARRATWSVERTAYFAPGAAGARLGNLPWVSISRLARTLFTTASLRTALM